MTPRVSTFLTTVIMQGATHSIAHIRRASFGKQWGLVVYGQCDTWWRY